MSNSNGKIQIDFDEDEEHLALIVEDDSVNRKFVTNALSEMGFKCKGAETVDEAVEQIDLAMSNKQNFEVIFLDIILKDEKTGIDFLKLRKDKNLEDQGIVVVMSGNEDAKLVQECHNYNIQNYVKKPISKTNLVNEITKVLNRIKQLKCPIKGYRNERKIGQGATGEVFLVRDKKTKEEYAMKKVQCDKTSSSETSYMLGVKAPTVLDLKDYKINDNYIYMIIEYAKNGTLKDWINKNSLSKYSVDHDQILLWMTEALLGLYVIHEKSLIHRDIKADNLFLCTDNIVKIGDLGIAKAIKSGAFTVCGTHHYMAPEIHQNKQYDSRVDIWALGIVLYELVMLKKPFEGQSDEIVDKVMKMEYVPFPKNIDPNLEKLLKLMLNPNSNSRYTAKELLQLDYIKEKIQFIIDENLFPIDDDILFKIMEDTNKPQGQGPPKSLKEEIKKSKQYFDDYSTAMQLDENAINKVCYQKTYFSKKYEDVISGSDLEITAGDFKITVKALTNLIKSKFILNVSNPNEEEFLGDDKSFYQIKILDDPSIDNSTIFPSWFDPRSKDPIKLTEECLDLALAVLKRINEACDLDVDIRNEVITSKDYFNFLVEIRQIQDIDFTKLKKNEKLAVILNLYQVMLIHHYIKQEVKDDSQSKGGLLSKMKGLVYTSAKTNICYIIGGHKLSIYELKNITLRKNKKPLDAYFKLVNDSDPRVSLINEGDNPKLLLVCPDPQPGSFADLGIDFRFTKFSADVVSELDAFVKDFITANVQIDESEISIPKFLKSYLVDFSSNEQELVKFLFKNHIEPSGKISSIIKAMNNKSYTLNYI